MPEFTDEVYAANLLAAKTEGGTEALVTLVKDTTWDTAEAMVESARNASKKITEVTTAKQAADASLTSRNIEFEAYKVAHPASPATPPSPTPPVVVPPVVVPPVVVPPVAVDEGAVLKTMTEAEEKTLTAMFTSNEDFKTKVSEGGEKAMAEALIGLRGLAPSTTYKSPFEAVAKKGNEDPSVSLQDALLKAHKQLTKGVPSPINGVPLQPLITGDDDRAPVKGSGGAGAFAKPED